MKEFTVERKEKYHIPMYMKDTTEFDYMNKYIFEKKYKHLQIMNTKTIERIENKKILRTNRTEVNIL